MTTRVEIVEEVPGVPKSEQWFIRHEGKTHYFADHADAVKWCAERGFEHKTEYFEY
ncbi:hypothetical protein [Mesorhizobium sp. M1A.F.Ca.ET.072.01.1.1]|uniref:hypothetical protein n=1 Tax=Mesorhizobium sp. M1A.F.Ca.ET.072.01.1.1 TaxID=2496753 RepID=UPI00167C41C6|nr:hypothetical protein [Mesorhizobium sp. M1A.F.Ca.ET.072.01.1.1]